MLAQQNKFINFLWLALAVSLPFFSHRYIRFEVGPLKAPIPLILIGVLFVAHFFLSMKLKNKLADPFSKLGYLLSGVLLAFVTWHFLSLAFFEADSLAFASVVKLLIGYFVLYVVVLFFPRDQVLLENFWCVVFGASAIGMGIFIYHYYVDFNSSFLSNNWEFKTRAGRNQLTWYLSFVLPFAVSSLWDSKKRYINLISVLVLFVALFYAGSRSALISIVLGLMFMLFLKIFFEGAKSMKKIIPFVLFAGVFLSGAWFVIVQYVDNPEMITRFETITPGQISNLEEDSRFALIQRGLNHFYSAPLTGIGLGQSSIKGTFDFHSTHNDYLLLLAELGIPGLMIFGAILLCLFLKLYPLKLNESGQVSWVFLGALSSLLSVTVSLFFINAYQVSLLWIYFGLILVGREIENNPKYGRNRVEKTSPATGFSSANFPSERPL
jgi:O-antigen ligase